MGGQHGADLNVENVLTISLIIFAAFSLLVVCFSHALTHISSTSAFMSSFMSVWNEVLTVKNIWQCCLKANGNVSARYPRLDKI